VDDRRIVSAIVFVIKNGLRSRDYRPHKTIDNRFIRWARSTRSSPISRVGRQAMIDAASEGDKNFRLSTVEP
jgi:hypothetical protein